MTDAGAGFIKGLGNPAGDLALISELVAAELGTWLGLNIPPFAIILRCDLQIEMLNHGGLITPPLFFSSAMDGAPRDGGDGYLIRLADPGAVARLVLFDTWIRNDDRCQSGESNSDNLLYTPTHDRSLFNITPIDHSHCFVEGTLQDDLPNEDLLTDPGIYGLFPEFIPFLDECAVDHALDRLSHLQRPFVLAAVNQTPAAWRLPRSEAQDLVDFICGRAIFLQEHFKQMLTRALTKANRD